ncbi:MAG: MarR family transcriptional regulator [Candidatus Leucobacter sulfamidivorax]|nr:MarR family transcriptional regulator [Candidatus Leucobacter sulfamidivorax]
MPADPHRAPAAAAQLSESEYQDAYERLVERMVPGAEMDAALLSMAVNRVATLIKQRQAVVFRELGRSSTAMHVLSTLAALGPTTPSEIARLTRVTAPSVSSLLRGLRRDGLVEVNSPDVEADGRTKLVSILPAGLELLREAMIALHGLEIEWARSVPAAERTRLVGTLRGLAQEVEDSGVGDSGIGDSSAGDDV